MATAIQTNSMTLGNQANKMYTMIQQHSPGQNTNNCVIQMPVKNSVIIQQQTKRPLLQASERNTVVVNNNTINIANNNTSDMLRCKRKINFAHVPYSTNGTTGPTHQPASVARRNARERNRVKQVNNGFATLRQHIPASVAAALSSSSSSSSSSSTGRGASKKLSKVETLRMAVEYIRSLQQMIQDHEAEINATSNTNMIENQYYTPSPDSNILIQQTPPCSESSASPTPSYSSEGSVSLATTPQSVYAPLIVYQPESYENYEPMSPEDEELLDVISWWQQQ